MPFGLKNARVTYERIVNKILKYQIKRNTEIYVDDMIVKSRIANSYVVDLTKLNMRLNLSSVLLKLAQEKFPDLYSLERNRCKPRKGLSYIRDVPISINKRSTTVNKVNSNAKSISIQI